MSVLLISVGGSPEPIVASIQHNNPEKIIFVVSPDTREKVRQSVMPAVWEQKKTFPDAEIIVIPDPQDLGAVALALLREMPVAMKKLGEKADWPEVVDYTGGTKPMSAGMVWASSRHACRFSYVGAMNAEDARTKNGVGVVVNGKEQWLLRENPWNQVAYYEVLDALNLFNHAQYARAAEAMQTLSGRLTESPAQYPINVLGGLFEGFALWDVFDHRKALSSFHKTVPDLRKVVEMDQPYLPGLRPFLEQVEICFEGLKNIDLERGLTPPLIWDLLANARRRADQEGKYEDAVARCYSAIEKLGAYTLLRDRGIQSACADPHLLPDVLREEYVRKYTTPTPEGKSVVRFGLKAVYVLLAAMNHPLGQRFMEHEQAITNALGVRNASILGHGAKPVGQKAFDHLFQEALFLAQKTPEELLIFPVLPIR